MIAVRPADTDADLEAWLHVRRVVLPGYVYRDVTITMVAPLPLTIDGSGTRGSH